MDEATWARGRGWALWKTLATYSNTFDDPEDADGSASAQRILGDIFSEYTAGAVTKPNP
ncbi:hypothetical protein [Phytohabitans flavus]|uniref:hypothetical protein n=1 Tax=Phytohabitans flavus TaxID=1076124 RepID=UPI00366FC465